MVYIMFLSNTRYLQYVFLLQNGYTHATQCDKLSRPYGILLKSIFTLDLANHANFGVPWYFKDGKVYFNKVFRQMPQLIRPLAGPHFLLQMQAPV